MRMRKKKWAEPELMQSSLFVADPLQFRGRWQSAFAKSQPLYLELGCGKGAFASQFALQNPHVNLLAIDISRDMLGVARRTADALFSKQQKTPDNLRLTGHDIGRIDLALSEQDRVERIFIFFCNPWYKPRHYKKRLTHPKQLKLYKQFLAPGGEIWFKTDDAVLYTHTLRYFQEENFEILWKSEDFEKDCLPENIQTEHERMYQEEGISIKGCIARFTGAENATE